jgi:D-alanyl-lipoteichoic acid acyltransferase DltB (MBOAT superfamily)
MTLTSILIFCVGALLYGWLLPARWRGWALFVASIVAIYWLQPTLVVFPLDFALPTATLALTVASWYLTSNTDVQRDDKLALVVTLLIVLLLTVLGTYVEKLTASVPPPLVNVLLALVGISAAFVVLSYVVQEKTRILPIMLLLIIAIFIVLKWEPLTITFAAWLRTQTGRQPALASAVDIGWLGFSYVSFRLIHTIRERQMGKLPDLTLREYMTYVIFFPSFTAGPIDRAERFIKDYRALPDTKPLLDSARILDGGSRIAMGLFKKFILASLLFPIALSAQNALQAQSAGGLWIFLYAYAFMLFFDFSGYSDIAIGIGRLYGVSLPENFDRPYLKSSITAFWQSWHITLSTWARFYVFTPLSRVLIKRKTPTDLAVLITQVATMLVIGLWHGITLNFIMWGVWHGVGLWIHKLYTDRTRLWYLTLKQNPQGYRAAEIVGVLLTFHFVLLGWVWFALPSFDLSLAVFRRLFGG